MLVHDITQTINMHNVSLKHFFDIPLVNYLTQGHLKMSELYIFGPRL
jgi:hypothetical protein